MSDFTFYLFSLVIPTKKSNTKCWKPCFYCFNSKQWVCINSALPLFVIIAFTLLGYLFILFYLLCCKYVCNALMKLVIVSIFRLFFLWTSILFECRYKIILSRIIHVYESKEHCRRNAYIDKRPYACPK